MPGDIVGIEKTWNSCFCCYAGTILTDYCLPAATTAVKLSNSYLHRY